MIKDRRSQTYTEFGLLMITNNLNNFKYQAIKIQVYLICYNQSVEEKNCAERESRNHNVLLFL